MDLHNIKIVDVGRIQRLRNVILLLDLCGNTGRLVIKTVRLKQMLYLLLQELRKMMCN